MKHSLACTLRGAGLALALTSLGALAQAPLQGTQVPGYYRLTVGDYEVTALFDGYNDLSPKLLEGLSQARSAPCSPVARLKRRGCRPRSTLFWSIPVSN